MTSRPTITSSQAAITPYAALRDEMRGLYLATRDWIERAEKGQFKRPPEWFSSQNKQLRAIEAVGREFNFIADNVASYEAWKASIVGERRTA